MVYQRPGAKKRVHAIRRGPDGSAFRKCKSCGISVVIALADMHDCRLKRKRLETQCGNGNFQRQKIQDQPRGNGNFQQQKIQDQPRENGNFQRQKIQEQPRSAFHFFMEEFIKTCIDGIGNEIEKDKKAREIWKNMSEKEKQPFVNQADKINSAYVELLLEEENEIQWVDDEADSAEVGKYDKKYEKNSWMYYYPGSSSRSGDFI